MEMVSNWTQIALESFLALGQKTMSVLPNVLGAIFLLILGWIVARIVRFIIRKALGVVKFNELSSKINADQFFQKANLSIKPSELVAKFVYWVIILLFFVTASDTLGWVVVSESISELISYLPKLFSAIVIFLVGFYIATIIRKGLKGIFDSMSVSSGGFVSTFAFYLIVVLVSLTSLNQAGVDTTVITSNVTLIVGGMMLAFAISFGFSSRDVLNNLLASFYIRSRFENGQKITIGDVSGTIEKVDSLSCVIKTSTGTVIMPASRLIKEDVALS